MLALPHLFAHKDAHSGTTVLPYTFLCLPHPHFDLETNFLLCAKAQFDEIIFNFELLARSAHKHTHTYIYTRKHSK